MLPTMYLKIGAALIIVTIIVWVYFYINSAFEERDKLRISTAAQEAQITAYQKNEVQNAQIRDAINESISKIRVTSNNYIKTVDNGKAPTVPDGTVIQLVPAGVLANVPSMPTFTNSSTNSTLPVSETN